MKLKIGSFLAIAVLILSGFTAGVSASETANNVNSAEYNVITTGYFLLPKENTEWCTVVLNNPRSSLNVRSADGRIVGKLKHGTQVYVDTYDGGFARVSVRRRGRLSVLGWVASEYLVC